MGALWLFILTQIKYQLFRNRGRSIIAMGVAALLCGSMAFYMGNIQSIQNVVSALADNIPVTATIVSRDGSKKTELFIDPEMFDALCDEDVTDVLATSEACGAWDESFKDQEFFFGGDVSMAALNNIHAWESLEEENLEWLDSADSSIFETGQAICILSEDSAQRFGVGLGDEVTISVYSVLRNSAGVAYSLVEESALKIVGIYHKNASASGKDVYISTAWMRSAAEQNNATFSYDSVTCRVDARNINEFKAQLPKIGFMPIFDGADNRYRGDAIVVDDEMFIKTDSRFRANLTVFQSFLFPFYALVASLVTLITFLMLRGSRRDIAIASSLGQPKWQTVFSNFFSTLLTYLAGCIVIVPIAATLTQVSLVKCLAVCGMFLVCAAVGIVLALILLLRFDTLALLTKTD